MNAPPRPPARRTRILVTGFAGFPGAPRNPTQAMIAALERRRARLARLGVELSLSVLPASFAEVGRALEAAAGALEPDAILCFGLARRRARVGVEAVARNRIGRLRPDARGAFASDAFVERGAPPLLRASAPAPQILARLARASFPAGRSNDAGDYVCNQALFLALRRARRALVGFIHVPPPERLGAPTSRPQEACADLAFAAVLAVLPAARRASRLSR